MSGKHVEGKMVSASVLYPLTVVLWNVPICKEKVIWAFKIRKKKAYSGKKPLKQILKKRVNDRSSPSLLEYRT